MNVKDCNKDLALMQRVSVDDEAAISDLYDRFGSLVYRTYQGVSGVLLSSGHVPTDDPALTTEAIGTLFLEREGYLLPFEAISVLLLVVLVGAVTLARRDI